MAIKYRVWALGLAPSWLKSRWGARLVAAIAMPFDMLGDQLVAGVNARFITECPDDALPYHGSERSMDRYPSETNSGFRARLQSAWVAWQSAGLAASIVQQLAGYGVTATVKTTVDWNWDGDVANWSRFWVVIAGHPWSRKVWGDGHTYGDGTVWGMDATPPEMTALRRIVRKWKPGHVVCANIIVVFDETTFDDDVSHMAGNWNVITNRSAAALYVDGEQA